MKLKVSDPTLGQLLSVQEEQFVVPLYQRPYSWSTEEIDQLWEDIAGMVHDEHFMGSVVLNDSDPTKPEIIDGQQRLTTLLIILALIRDEYSKMESKYSQRPQRLLEADEWAEAGGGRFRLRLGDANWSVFRDFFMRPPGEEGRGSLEKQSELPKNVLSRNAELLNNAKRLRVLLRDYIGDKHGADREARLLDLEEKVTKRLRFVSIRVETVEDAFLLFETLNDRGLQLSAADLVKSHLLSRFESENGKELVPEAAADWSDLIESLKGADIGRFLRYYLLMFNDKVQKDRVFRLFKKLLEDRTAESLLLHLRSMARYYGEFTSPEAVDHPATRAALQDLADLRATTCYVALLPAREALAADLGAFARFARLTEALAYRWTTIVGQNAQQLESIFQQAGSQFVQFGADGLSAATQQLLEQMPGRSTFLASFAHKRMGTQYVARYTLRRIESALRTGEYTLGPASKVHLEHVMPQHLSSPWAAELGESSKEKHAEYVDRWGNITLLDEKINREARDSSFDAKKKKYSSEETGSMVKLTQLICKEQNWGPGEIENRQKWLAEVAEQVWSIDGIDNPGSIAVPAYPYVPPEDAVRQIQELITEHETRSVEFKSTGRTNLHTGQADRKMVDEVLDTIAAFANSEGGSLLIGVTDSGQIHGVEIDYKLFKDGGRDDFTRWVTDVTKDNLDYLVAQSLIVSYVSIEGHDVCRVDVPPSPTPVFKSEQGVKAKRFYVRMNNSTNELHGPDLLNYKEKRWPKPS